MKLRFMLPVSLLVVAGLLAGCEQQVTRETRNQGVELKKEAQTRLGNGAGNGRQQRLKTTDYVVDPSDNLRPSNLLTQAQSGELSEEEKAGLIKMREEEKLAHDVYTKMYERWGQRIFSNIARSEQTHTDTLKYLIDKYGLEDPVKDSSVGVFTNPTLASLYTTLVDKGNQSLLDALIVGATVEDLDIKDLEDLLPQTDNEDIRIAYQNLDKGSRNHLRAFVRNIRANGGDYSPQYISQERFEEILAGEQERGAVDADGRKLDQSFHSRGNDHSNNHGNQNRENPGQGLHQVNGQGQGKGQGGYGQGRGRGGFNRSGSGQGWRR